MKFTLITKMTAATALFALAYSISATSSAGVFAKVDDGEARQEKKDEKKNDSGGTITALDALRVINAVHEFSRDPKSGEITELIRISRHVDENSPSLLRAFLDNSEIPSLRIIVQSHRVDAEGKPIKSAEYTLDRCFIKSWSTSGDADDRPTEEVAFYRNKIAFSYASTADEKAWEIDAAAIVADSFSFSVEREMKESGEKGVSSPFIRSIPEGAKDAQRSRGDTTLGG